MRQAYARALAAAAEDIQAQLVDPEICRRSAVAEVARVRADDLTVCVFTIGGDLADEGSWRRLREHADQLAIRCEPVAPDASVVVVTVPPQQRLD